MAITITNRDELIRALSALGYQVAAEQGVFDGLFAGESGVPVEEKPEIVALTAVTTPDATDEATAITLANALKVKVNAIIAALKA